MATTMTSRGTGSIPSTKSEHGFSLIEVMISMAVLTIGLLSLLGVFGLALASTEETQQDMIAKQLANEALESIVTARDTAQIQWDQVQNVSGGGIFLDGYQPTYMAGQDGIFGTADDALTGQYITITEPGPDGIYGTSDDVSVQLSNYQRQVQILPVVAPGGGVVATLRSINITVQYHGTRTRGLKTYVLNSFISQYR